MAEPYRPLRTRGLTAIDGAMGLLVVLLIVQMWLLTAALESFLAGHAESALPAAVLSGLLFAACGAIYLFIHRLDATFHENRSGGDDVAADRV